MKYLMLLILATIAGCSTTKTVYVPTECPKINLPPEPYYPVADLKQGDSAATVAKAYVATVGLCLDDNVSVRRVCGER